MKIKQLFLPLIASLMLSACGGQSGPGLSDNSVLLSDSESVVQQVVNRQPLDDNRQERVLYIKHHKAECESYQVKLCYLVRQSPSEPWSFLYEEIEGFDYQWGHDYQVRVHIPSADISEPLRSYNSPYELIEILNRSDYQSGVAFQLTVRGGHDGIESVGDGKFTLRGSIEMQCQYDDCTTLQSLLIQGQSMNLQLQHVSEDAPLMLGYILCADAPVSYEHSCGWSSYDE